MNSETFRKQLLFSQSLPPSYLFFFVVFFSPLLSLSLALDTRTTQTTLSTFFCRGLLSVFFSSFLYVVVVIPVVCFDYVQVVFFYLSAGDVLCFYLPFIMRFVTLRVSHCSFKFESIILFFFF